LSLTLNAWFQVGQAIASGPDCNGRQWLIVKQAAGAPLQFTSTWQASIKKGATACQADLTNVIEKIVATAGQFVTSFGVMHNDLQPENVFFTDDLSSSTLIDWGRGTQVGKVRPHSTSVCLCG
jgi:RIO-like serine/threonine protein kinase